jgi:hypothetical protein
MPDDTDTTLIPEGQEDAAATAAAAKTATEGGKDEVSLYISRLNGQTAKVTELTRANAAADARAAAAEAKLADYESGKLGADEALRAQLVAEQAKTKAAEQKAALALVKAQYPESFSELGEATATLTTEQLAALEARLTGDDGSDDGLPTPKRHNETKSSSGTPGAAKARTVAEIEADLLAMSVPEGW